jgi:hypothetical protein
MATGQRCTVDMWRTRCAECERYFQTTAFHGHDPKLAPTLCRRCAFNKREQALTIAERTKPATRTAVAKLAAAEQRLAVARLAEQDIAKREVAIAERKRAATIADLDRRRVEAKVSAEREREAKRTADAGREAKRAAHVAGVFEHLERRRPFQGRGAGSVYGLVGLQARRGHMGSRQFSKLPV